MFDYSKLKGRIVEKFDTYKNFTRYLDMGSTTFYSKMHNLSDFTSQEIFQICNLLDIPHKEIPIYFFTVKVQKNEQYKGA
ncbi:hypothetical protein ABID14_000386 [Peptoniphilus olsenii]|uniref:DUF739 family protein n=1 Tax=Peptoniphilus olsenii TaxID=411570 RepID=A0ABV2J927_9FIRM